MVVFLRDLAKGNADFKALLEGYAQWKEIEQSIAVDDLEIILFDVGSEAQTTVPVSLTDIKIDDDVEMPTAAKVEKQQPEPKPEEDDFDFDEPASAEPAAKAEKKVKKVKKVKNRMMKKSALHMNVVLVRFLNQVKLCYFFLRV